MQKLEEILKELEKFTFEVEVYNGDFEGADINNLLCLGDVRDVLRKHMNNDWIPAKNKPDEDAFYVATMSGTLVGQEVPFVGLAEFEDGEWVDGDDVIAWMPLPEPYCPEAKAPERKQEWKERMLRNFLRGHETIRR